MTSQALEHLCWNKDLSYPLTAKEEGPKSPSICVLRSAMDRDISPPAVKRRKLAVTSTPSHNSEAREGTVLAESMCRPRAIRIFSWNINGIEPYLPPSSLKITSFFKPSNPDRIQGDRPSQPRTNGLRAFLSRHGWPEVLFLQELKVQQANSKILASLSSFLNTPLNADDTLTDDRTYSLDAVLPRDRYNARGFQGKLYGVATILRADFARDHVARVRDVDWDLEGRVSVVELKPGAEAQGGKHNKPLALVNVYAVNGTSAPYRSPRDGRVVGTRHDHKLAFHSRLRDECLALEARGFHVVVAGDLNVARGILDGHPNLRTVPRQHCVNRADFNAKFFGEEDNRRAQAYVGDREREAGRAERCLDAVDVFRAMRGGERRYTYYPRTRDWGTSCDRVDLILVSKGLWEAGRILETGILDTPQERGLSDHVPFWVEVALGKPPDDEMKQS
ncbi:hypothetical protein VTK56DRAFT_2618 [Thermocarpiscus australiensis]